MSIDFRRTALLATSGLAVLLVAASASAQLPRLEQPVASPPGSGATDEETLLKQGVELREKGDDQGAMTVFGRAYALSKGARALAQLALAEQALGHWVDAETHLAGALSRGDDPWVTRNKTLLESALTDIRGHLGSLELSGGVAGAEVRVNGVDAGTLPLATPLRVLAGSVAIEVRAPNYLPVIRTVMVPSGGLARESVIMVATDPVSPGPVAPLKTPPPDTGGPAVTVTVPSGGTAPASGWSGRKTAALVLGIAALGGAAVGTSFLVIRNGHAADFNNMPCTTADPTPSAGCSSLHDQVDSATKVSAISFVGSGLLAGAAAYLFLSDRFSGSSNVALGWGAFGVRCLPTMDASVVCAGRL